MSETEDTFAILIPDEASLTASLTAPIAASTELSKMFITTMKKVHQFEKETWEERIVIDNGDGTETVRIIVHENPRLLEWFKEGRRIGVAIAKINSEAEVKNIDHKLRLMDMFLRDEDVVIPKEVREKYILKEIQRKNTKKTDEEIEYGI